MTHKRCSKCTLEKEITEFNKCKQTPTGLHYHCRTCAKECKKEWDIKNKELNILKRKSEKGLEQQKNGTARANLKYQTDSEYREKIKEKNNIRRRKEEAKIVARIQRKKWSEIPQNKISQNLRRRVRIAIKNNNKFDSTKNLLNIDIDSFKLYLENKFSEGMSWDNYGINGWHIDHILPCSYFDLSIEDSQRICFNYKNLQPLWETDNIAKSDKIVIDVQKHIDEIKKDLNL